jgi:hypothetical protein
MPPAPGRARINPQLSIRRAPNESVPSGSSRPLYYYTKPVPGTGVVLVGYPREYAMNRMP